MAARAAGMARWWNGRGRLRHTMRTLSPYFSRMAWKVGSMREQKGHWKSEKTTSVMGAKRGPRTGDQGATSTFLYTAGGGGGGAGGSVLSSTTPPSSGLMGSSGMGGSPSGLRRPESA